MARHRRQGLAAIRYRPRAGGAVDLWRQIAKTPTFALGLAVIAAAVLAFGSTQTYLRFSGSGPDTGCGAASCANPAASPTPSPGEPGNRPDGVHIAYRTLITWPTGYTGELTITNRSKHQLTHWRLAMAYKRSRVTDMSGAKWLPRANGVSGTIEPDTHSDPLRPNDSVRISYTATGIAHAPTGCDFNGVRCRIK